MNSGESGLGHNLVKFQALERQNSFWSSPLSPNCCGWRLCGFRRLDKSAVASTGVKVYRVKYGDARQMAALLTNIFTGGASTGLEFGFQSDRAQLRGDDVEHGGAADRRVKAGDAERERARRRPTGSGTGSRRRHLNRRGPLGSLPGGGPAVPVARRSRACASRPTSPTTQFSFTPTRKNTGSLSGPSTSSTGQDCRSPSMSRSPRSRSMTNWTTACSSSSTKEH